MIVLFMHEQRANGSAYSNNNVLFSKDFIGFRINDALFCANLAENETDK